MVAPLCCQALAHVDVRVRSGALPVRAAALFYITGLIQSCKNQKSTSSVPIQSLLSKRIAERLCTFACVLSCRSLSTLRYGSGDCLSVARSPSSAASNYLSVHDYHQVSSLTTTPSTSAPALARSSSIESERLSSPETSTMAYGMHAGSFPSLLSPPEQHHLVAAQPSYPAGPHHHGSTDSIQSNLYVAQLALKTEGTPGFYSGEAVAPVSHPGASHAYLTEPTIPQPSNQGCSTVTAGTTASMAPLYRPTCFWPTPQMKASTFPPVNAPAPASPSSVPWYGKSSPTTQSPPLPVLPQGSSVFTFPSSAGPKMAREGSLPGSLVDLSIVDLRKMWHAPPASGQAQQPQQHSTSESATSLPPLMELNQSSAMDASTGSPSMSEHLDSAMPIGSNGTTPSLPNIRMQHIDMDRYAVVDEQSETLEDSK